MGRREIEDNLSLIADRLLEDVIRINEAVRVAVRDLKRLSECDLEYYADIGFREVFEGLNKIDLSFLKVFE